jgi:hypothetical protein
MGYKYSTRQRVADVLVWRYRLEFFGGSAI